MIDNEYMFPTTAQASVIINSLEKQNWVEFDGTNIDEYIKLMTSKIMEPSGLLYGSLFDTDNIVEFFPTIYRVRKVADIKNKFLRSQYSYPPVEFTTKNLRANLINNPVFYASDNPGSAILEYIRQWVKIDTNNEEYMISCWQFNTRIKYYLAFFIPSSIGQKNKFASFNKTIPEQIVQLNLPNLNEDQIAGITLIYDYYSNLFTRDEKRSISSFIGHYYLYNNPLRPTILVYPSLQSLQTEINIALHPNLADEFLHLSHIYKVKFEFEEINRNDNVEINIKFSLFDEFAVVKNDKINWTNKNYYPDLFKKLHENDFKKFKPN